MGAAEKASSGGNRPNIGLPSLRSTSDHPRAFIKYLNLRLIATKIVSRYTTPPTLIVGGLLWV